MLHATTILSVRDGNKVVMAGDGQVSVGDTVFKSNAKKVRRLYQGDVLAGFAGGTADAFTLFERLKLEDMSWDDCEKYIMEQISEYQKGN